MTIPTIRPMTLEDAASVALWMPKLSPWVRYGLTPERAQGRLENAIARGDIVLVVDVDERKACGFGWCIPDGAFDFSPYLRWLAIRPDHAGAGIGSALLAGIEQAAAVYSRELFLLAADFNTGAHRFYERHGYSKVGVLADYVVSGVGELVYWKRLQHTNGAA